ncbi:MAG: HNH endonuclease [Deltaproteobacteria bacterium]|nr:HNH endonuclease [Deltaproteobacteria bacterium]
MALNSALNKRVKEFLSIARLGIDLGEAAGGIALVRGNEILHDETYLEFREATLETRRTLRRARRTRNAKKMRLARLRSWVLRQFIPSTIPGAGLKDGKSRLPDPYHLMQDKKYQTLPGFYRVEGKDPSNASGWVDAAKNGEVDAEGFVIALTHIFKRRGYKYDDRDLEELSDARLAEFMDSCCVLKDACSLADDLRVEIERREKPKLMDAYEQALVRKPQLRKALPRQIKENDLRTIVERFGTHYGLDAAVVKRWRQELVGLINKVVRPARYDNRLRSGCSWCGKKTPRLKKAKIRELNLHAAVENIRARPDERLRRLERLEERQKEPFWNWYQRRIEEKEGKYSFPKGPKAPLTERAPTKDNIEKYLESVKVPKQWMKDARGKTKFGFPMLAQLDNLLNRTLRRGRAKLCVEHLNMGAEGKTKKDAGIEWQTMRIRRAPNPKREQHDARVLRRVEDILFIKGKRGVAAWRHGPVSFITLEVPKPQTEKAGKGQQTERKDTNMRERLLAETDGRCIYCWKEISVEGTEMDHIVPKKGKGGPDLQLNRIASCHDCNHPDTGKGNRLPREWLNGEQWAEFEKRVRALRLPESKESLLLLKAGESFPDDPTSFARVGGRVGAFVAEIIRLFEKYGVEPPTANYTGGKPHIQCVEGRWTRELRRSWLYKDREAKEDNFPKKDRTDLFNHAEDAAILAATPPHTWRLQILAETALRPCARRGADGKPLFGGNGKVITELRRRPGVALLDLAPDWAGFMKQRTSPIVRVLGKLKADWKSQLTDLTFYQKPRNLDGPLYVRKPDPGSNRRVTTSAQKGGLVIQMPNADRTTGVRKVQVKPYASVAAVVWRYPGGRKGNIQISLERPKAIRKFVGSLIDPPIPKGAVRLGRLERMQTIRLEDGFYRVKELSDKHVIVIPENAVPDAVAKRMGIPKDERRTLSERTLGKRELQALFADKLAPPVKE